MPEAAFGAPPEGAFDALKPIAKALGTLFITMIGMMIGCTLGSLTYPMPPAVGAIAGGVIGMVVFGLVACCATGLLYEFLPKELDASAMVPSVLADQMGGHGTFSMIMTVHELTNVRVSGRLFNKPELFIKAECAGNPVKQTCVRQDGKFDEQFKIECAATCKSLVFLVKDQHLFSSSSVGYVCVDILQDIIRQDFPFKHEFEIEAGEEFTLVASEPSAKLVVSFDPVDPAMGDGARALQSKTAWKAPQYGSVTFLSSLSFNQTAKLNYSQQQDQHGMGAGPPQPGGGGGGGQPGGPPQV